MTNAERITQALRVYFSACFSYGFIRSVTYDYKNTKKYYNEITGRYEVKDMLLIDKIGRISGSTCAAGFFWPGMLGEDLARLECAAKGKDTREYQ